MLTKEQKKRAREQLKKLNGDPPHDTWSNYVYGDGYFARSLEDEFNMSIHELKKASGYNRWKSKERKAYAEYRKAIGEPLKEKK